jgi:TolB-like protein/DNA-binding winged helix-turn-helix (wHTH) protein
MSPGKQQKCYRFEDLTLDAGRLRLYRGTERIALSTRLLRLLQVLVEHAPNVVSRDVLSDSVWGPRRVVTPENIAQHVAQLRRALDDDAAHPRYIESIRGEGYRLIPDVHTVPDDISRLGRLVPVVGALVAIIVVAFVAGLFIGESDLPSPSLDGRIEPAMECDIESLAGLRTIIVLPLIDRSADRSDQHFADGMTEELINRLRSLDALDVLSGTSSFALKDFDGDPAEVGLRTGASHIVEGSVRRTDQIVRISVQLARTADGVQVCSGTWDRSMDDILGIQAEIANEIGRSLNATIERGATNDEFYGLSGTSNPVAYELYLRALGLDRAGGARNLRRAEELLREAIEIDPDFMAARGILARTLGSLRYLQPDQADELIAEWNEITEFIQRAIPDHPIVLIAQGLRSANAYDWIGAERALSKAVATLPAGRVRDEAEGLLGAIQRVVGQYRNTLAQVRESYRRDPLSLSTSMVLQGGLYALGNVAAAEAEYLRSRDLSGDRSYVENVAVMRAVVEGLGEREISERLGRLESSMNGRVTIVSELVALVEDRDRAIDLLNREFESGGTWPLTIAWWADYHGDTDLALASLRKYFEDTSRVVSSLWSPLLRNTRRTDGFADIARDFGLLDYWQETGNWGDFCQPVNDSDFSCE